jgi:hypothetical protein
LFPQLGQFLPGPTLPRVQLVDQVGTVTGCSQLEFELCKCLFPASPRLLDLNCCLPSHFSQAIQLLLV